VKYDRFTIVNVTKNTFKGKQGTQFEGERGAAPELPDPLII